MDLPSFNILSLCSGIGGLDLGLHIAREDARTVCYLEREAFAAEVLAEKIESGVFPPTPIYSDLTTFDPRPWRGVVDCIVAGLPCQPFSVAGRRKGEGDDRYLWPEFFRILEGTKAPLAFLENVPGLLQFFRPIGEELCRLGYGFEAGLFTAAEVGVPHKRERVFILAYRPRECLNRARTAGPGRRREPANGNAFLGDPNLAGLQERPQPEDGRGNLWKEGPPPGPPGPSSPEWAGILARWPELAPAVADTYRPGRQQESRGASGDEEADGRTGRDGSESNGNYQPERSRSVAVTEEEVEPAVRPVADGPEPVVSRIDSLRASGNAVVPLQAAFAFEILSRKIGSCL